MTFANVPACNISWQVLIRELLAASLLWRYVYVNVSGVLMFSAMVGLHCSESSNALVCACPKPDQCFELWRWLTWWLVFMGRHTIPRLYIWAIKHPASGYVQGMNDLVTPFYLVFLGAFVDNTAIDVHHSPCPQRALPI